MGAIMSYYRKGSFDFQARTDINLDSLKTTNQTIVITNSSISCELRCVFLQHLEQKCNAYQIKDHHCHIYNIPNFFNQDFPEGSDQVFAVTDGSGKMIQLWYKGWL